MKTTLNLVALSVVIFLSACSTSDNFSAMKRKYRPGYYVEFGGNKKAQPTINKKETVITSNNKQKSTVAETLINTEKKEIRTYPLTASNTDKPYTAPTSKDHGAKLTTAAKNISGERNQHSVKSPSIFKKIIVNKISKKIKKDHSSSNDDDAMLILEIILCFFWVLNLIAIYLKDGKTITANFWVTLILDLLFWIPGLIFSLLVVLDVINIA